MRTFLFSIDLEDVPLLDGKPSRMPALIENYLQWLAGHRAKCTFFCVGEVARLYPSTIQAIQAEGHEIAMHSDRHQPLAHLGKEGFRQDLEANRDALAKAGVAEVYGYRAPVFSLTAETPWAHEVLASLGFAYSSSVLPEKNPLFGWPGFAKAPSSIATPSGSIWELPITTGQICMGRIPIAGGTYLRLLPTWLASKTFSEAGNLVLGYFHPYDIDAEQPRIMHPGLESKPWLNPLMYIGRKSLLDKLDALIKTTNRIIPYNQYLYELNNDREF
jgi:polysaccharide deacetylase family protein (PEP-CTERM system associated)